MLEDLRKNKKMRKRVTPDEYFQSNGVSIARFGKFVVTKNIMTPTQHKTLKKKCAEKYPEMCKEIDEIIAYDGELTNQAVTVIKDLKAVIAKATT